MEQFAEDLARAGDKVVTGDNGTIWRENEGYSLMRFPIFDLTEPSSAEIERVLKEGGKPLLTYQTAPTVTRLFNGHIFIYEAENYDIATLGKNARRDINIALRRLKYEFIDWDTCLRFGLKPFADTRRRVGLSDGTEEEYRRRFGKFRQNRAHYALGCWKEEEKELAAFSTLIVVDGFVAASGFFSADDHLSDCPTNGMLHTILDTFINQRKCRLVSYGSSSVQDDAQDTGLHKFKLKAGFEAREVVRRFDFQPYLKPFVNRATLFGMRQLVRLSPGNRALRKAVGVMETSLG